MSWTVASTGSNTASQIATKGASCRMDIRRAKQESSYYFVPVAVLVNLVVLLVICATIACKTTFSAIEWHQSVLLVLYVNALLIAIKKTGFVGSIPMMLYMFFLFLLSNVAFDFFGFSSMRYSRVHLNYKISNETLLTILVMYELFLLATILVLLFSKKRVLRTKMENNPTLERYSTLALLVLGIPSICEYVIRMVGYAMTSTAYAESYIDDGSTGLLSICVILFRATIPIYLASFPKGRYKAYCMAVIVIFVIASMFGGSRSTGLMPALFLVWYYARTGHSMSIGKFFAILASAFVVMTLVVSVRGSASSWNLVEQINSDNVAFSMTANAIDYQDNLVNTRGNTFFLSGFVNPIMRYVVAHDAFTGGRNYEYANASFSLDDKIMYAIAPNAFAEGRGFGSSAVLEFYLFAGFIGVVAMTLLYLWLTLFFERRSSRSVLGFVFFYWWFQAVVFSPRATPLPSLFYVALSFAILLVIALLYRRTHKDALASSFG